MDQLRLFFVYMVAITVINGLLRAYVWDSFFIVIATAVWAVIGLRRVFRGRAPTAPDVNSAIKVVIMAFAWPLLPRSK